MKNSSIKTLALALMIIMLVSTLALAQEKEVKAPVFKEIKTLPHTAPKSQGASGTCWVSAPSLCWNQKSSEWERKK